MYNYRYDILKEQKSWLLLPQSWDQFSTTSLTGGTETAMDVAGVAESSSSSCVLVWLKVHWQLPPLSALARSGSPKTSVFHPPR